MVQIKAPIPSWAQYVRLIVCGRPRESLQQASVLSASLTWKRFTKKNLARGRLFRLDTSKFRSGI